MQTQKDLFNFRNKAYKFSLESLEARKEQANKQLEGMVAQRVSAQKNVEVLDDRLIAHKKLYDQGFLGKANMLDIEAKKAEGDSRLSSLESEIARVKQSILEIDSQIMSTKSEHTSRIVDELRQIQVQRNEASEQYIALTDALNRIIIRSPVDGLVIDLHYHTKGGVVSPGNPIAEIVPSNDKLLIEAKIPNSNISSVHIGLKAKVRFNAFKQRTTPSFEGTVISLSPDVIQDRQAAAMMDNPMMTRDGSMYVAMIEIDMDNFNKIAKERNLELHPGMSADIQIVTGTRTLLRYMLDPLIDQIFKGMNEK
jgi:HlyD family type I secretion membrane fusion protein